MMTATQILIQHTQNLLPEKIFQNRKVSGHPKDTGNKKFLDFCKRGPFLEISLFLRILLNFLQTQTLAQDALNMQPQKIFQKRKVSVRSGDTGNAKFVENFTREIFLKISNFEFERRLAECVASKSRASKFQNLRKKHAHNCGNGLELFPV